MDRLRFQAFGLVCALGIFLGATPFGPAESVQPERRGGGPAAPSGDAAILSDGGSDQPQPLFRTALLTLQGLAGEIGTRTLGPASFARTHACAPLALREEINDSRSRAAERLRLDSLPALACARSGILTSHSSTAPPSHA